MFTHKVFCVYPVFLLSTVATEHLMKSPPAPWLLLMKKRVSVLPCWAARRRRPMLNGPMHCGVES